jgi:CheY-like chemotaxis protein
MFENYEIVRVADELFWKPVGVENFSAKTKQADGTETRILVVDDQRMIADTTTEILNQAGFEAFAAYDGYAALEIAAKLHPEFLLTDVMMPLMNGMDLAIAITRMFPETKILLFSGQAGIADILEKGQGEGYVFELVAKPIHPDKLIDLLKKKQ